MCYRPIDIDRSPGMIGAMRFMSRMAAACGPTALTTRWLRVSPRTTFGAKRNRRATARPLSRMATAQWHWLSLNHRKKR
jgi:hypothetical protein